VAIVSARSPWISSSNAGTRRPIQELSEKSVLFPVPACVETCVISRSPTPYYKN